VAHDAVQQCWRVSPGPDFMLVVQASDMPHYLAISQEGQPLTLVNRHAVALLRALA
jgi:hypothetical protein